MKIVKLEKVSIASLFEIIETLLHILGNRPCQVIIKTYSEDKETQIGASFQVYSEY